MTPPGPLSSRPAPSAIFQGLGPDPGSPAGPFLPESTRWARGTGGKPRASRLVSPSSVRWEGGGTGLSSLPLTRGAEARARACRRRVRAGGRGPGGGGGPAGALTH